jgi:hypothetical protein
VSRKDAHADARLRLPATSAHAHEARHFLALPGDVRVDEVEVLAASRFGATKWEVVPHDLRGADLPAGRIAGAGEPGILRLTRHTTLRGPYAPEGDGFDAGLAVAGAAFAGAGAGIAGTGAAMAFDVICPRDRWPHPAPLEGGDKDGIVRSFPAGLPNREEARVVAWLVAAARRLGGSVRLDVGGMWGLPESGSSPIGTGVLLTPDPDAGVDLSVYSDIWLEPAACHRVAQAVHPMAQLALQGEPFAGPPPGAGERSLLPGAKGGGLSAEQRRTLHAAADAYDMAALAGPQVLDGYGVMIDLGVDGLVAVEVQGEDVVPPVLRAVPWAAGGCVVYRVRWSPPDDVDANLERPSHTHVVARRRAAGLVSRLTLAIWQAVGGEIADDADFLVAPEDL